MDQTRSKSLPAADTDHPEGKSHLPGAQLPGTDLSGQGPSGSSGEGVARFIGNNLIVWSLVIVLALVFIGAIIWIAT